MQDVQRTTSTKLRWLFITNLDFNPFCCNLFGRYPRGHVLQWGAGLCELRKGVCAREKQCGAKEGFEQRLRKRDERRGRMRVEQVQGRLAEVELRKNDGKDGGGSSVNGKPTHMKTWHTCASTCSVHPNINNINPIAHSVHVNVGTTHERVQKNHTQAYEL